MDWWTKSLWWSWTVSVLLWFVLWSRYLSSEFECSAGTLGRRNSSSEDEGSSVYYWYPFQQLLWSVESTRCFVKELPTSFCVILQLLLGVLYALQVSTSLVLEALQSQRQDNTAAEYIHANQIARPRIWWRLRNYHYPTAAITGKPVRAQRKVYSTTATGQFRIHEHADRTTISLKGQSTQKSAVRLSSLPPHAGPVIVVSSREITYASERARIEYSDELVSFVRQHSFDAKKELTTGMHLGEGKHRFAPIILFSSLGDSKKILPGDRTETTVASAGDSGRADDTTAAAKSSREEQKHPNNSPSPSPPIRSGTLLPSQLCTVKAFLLSSLLLLAPVYQSLFCWSMLIVRCDFVKELADDVDVEEGTTVSAAVAIPSGSSSTSSSIHQRKQHRVRVTVTDEAKKQRDRVLNALPTRQQHCHSHGCHH